MTEQLPLFENEFRERHPEFASWGLEELLACWKARFGEKRFVCTVEYDHAQDKTPIIYRSGTQEKVDKMWIAMSMYLFEKKLLSVDRLHDPDIDCLKYYFYANR